MGAMPPALPDPIEVPWTMKAVDSAETRVETLPDGRLCCSIVHDLVRDVTPRMLVWWFNHMDGDVEIGGRRVPRYRAWHPRDHVAVRYARKAADGANMGPGSRVHIRECFARNPAWTVDIVDDVLRLDERGFVHANRRLGVEVFRMEYTFERTPAGTRYVNRLVAGAHAPAVRGVFNSVLRPRLFPDEMGRAWIRHNVEEVGNLQYFLPALFEAEHAV
jgi:hypothetical protein